VRFIIQMAKRELRSSWRRLVFFFICIAIGVGSIVALRSMIRNVNRAVASEARALLTADVRVDSDRPWTGEVREIIDRLAKPPLIDRRVETIESVTMVRPAESGRAGSMMIELKGIEPGFPLVGQFKLAGGEDFDYSLIANGGAVVAASLLERLRLNIGDRIMIGNAPFEIRGVFSEEPGGGGGFRLGPRVFIERGAVEASGLTGFGSRARRKILFTTPEGRMEGLTRQLRAELREKLVNVRSYKDSEENLNEQFSRAENYLSLTGLVILVLGGIGISSVTRVFVDQKKKSIAILKCVGGTGARITMVYLAQVVVLGLAGSSLGLVLARLALYAVQHYYSSVLPAGTDYSLHPSAVAQGLGVGLLISILFSALPLLGIRRIKPNVLLREHSGGVKRRLDFLTWSVGVVVLLGLLMLVSWQAGSLKVGLYFLVGLGATAATLLGAAALLIASVRRIGRVPSFAMRQAINSLYRPGNQTRVIVMVVGLGVFLVLSIQSLQSNLLREFDLNRRGKLPNMFLIDIQKDQKQGVADLVERETGERPILIATLRARIVAVNQKEIELDKQGGARERARLGREYVVTYRQGLEENETVIDGEFWGAEPSSEAEVSIEESLRGTSGIDVGSTITFDIQGRKVTATVTSIRRVDWRNSRTGFMIVFRPGVLEEAPQMLVAALNGPTGEVERSRFQRALLDSYPNISVIDVTEIIAYLTRIANNITLAVSFIGGFVFLSGTLILIGSIAMTKFQRIYEAAVLKTLGAKRKTILLIILGEYGLIGLVAGVIGAAFAVGLSYAASRQIFEIPWSFLPVLSLIGVAATVALVTVVGVVSTIDVLAKKPLAILRAE
jgi:putative ABC transport system permease protein